jgi:hypothetical protein
VKRRELDILFVATRAALLFLLPLWISDCVTFQDYARKVIPGGQWPYMGSFDFEYPPLAFPIIGIPGWILDALGAKTTESYRMLFAAMFILPFDVLLYRKFRRKPPIVGAAFLYLMLTCVMGLLIYDRFDLIVGFLMVWPFLGDKEPSDARFAWSWGLGGALKLVPLLLAPARVLSWEGPLRARAVRLVKFSLITLGPILLSGILAAVLGKGTISFLSRHSDRGVQIESLAGSVVMFLKSCTSLVSAKVEWNFGAQHLSKIPYVVEIARALFIGALLATLAMLAWPGRRRDALSASWLLISAFVTFGYVLSPQFLLWLVPLAICAAARVPAGGKREAWLYLFGAATVITGVHFRFYWDYVNLHPPSTFMVLLRNFLLVALWLLSWAWMETPAKGGEPTAPVLESAP